MYFESASCASALSTSCYEHLASLHHNFIRVGCCFYGCLWFFSRMRCTIMAFGRTGLAQYGFMGRSHVPRREWLAHEGMGRPWVPKKNFLLLMSALISTCESNSIEFTTRARIIHFRLSKPKLFAMFTFTLKQLDVSAPVSVHIFSPKPAARFLPKPSPIPWSNLGLSRRSHMLDRYRSSLSW